jgi:hypothetical protein
MIICVYIATSGFPKRLSPTARYVKSSVKCDRGRHNDLNRKKMAGGPQYMYQLEYQCQLFQPWLQQFCWALYYHWQRIKPHAFDLHWHVFVQRKRKPEGFDNNSSNSMGDNTSMVSAL